MLQYGSVWDSTGYSTLWALVEIPGHLQTSGRADLQLPTRDQDVGICSSGQSRSKISSSCIQRCHIHPVLLNLFYSQSASGKPVPRCSNEAAEEVSRLHRNLVWQFCEHLWAMFFKKCVYCMIFHSFQDKFFGCRILCVGAININQCCLMLVNSNEQSPASSADISRNPSVYDCLVSLQEAGWPTQTSSTKRPWS